MLQQRRLAVLSLGIVSAWTAVAQTTAPANNSDLTLTEALARTLAQSPELGAAHFDMAIAEARRLQASLRKNPEVSLEIEDIRLTRGPSAYTRSGTIQGSGAGLTIGSDSSTEQGAAPGFGEAQATLRLSQLVELGGKRVKRMRVAEKEKDLARWDYETLRLDVLTETIKSFVAVLNAQEMVKLADEDVNIAQRVVDTVEARVEAGKVSPIETQKAQNELAARIIAKDREAGLLENARTKLAAGWGAAQPDFARATGDYYVTLPVPSYDALEAETRSNPDLARWADEMELRQASLAAQRAQRTPDVAVELGFRTTRQQTHQQQSQSFSSDGVWGFSAGESGFSSHHANSLVFMFSLPVPLFDRNQGGIQEAEHEAAKAAQMKRKAQVGVNSGLHAAYANLLQAESRVSSLNGQILPQARDIFAKTEEGYRQGKFSYIEVLDAQRSQSELTAQYVEALKDYHDAVADVERLSGRPVSGAEPDFEPSANEGRLNP